MADEIQELSEETSMRDDLEAAVAEVETLEAAESEAPEAPVVEPETPVEEDKADDRPRDETGKFVKKDDQPEEVKQPEEEQPEEVSAEPTQESMAGATPPPGYSVAAKQAWATTPPAIREAIAKRETEINNGFAKLKDYAGLDDHIQAARATGQELPQVLANYRAAEDLLQRDFIGGVKWLAQSYGVDLGQLSGALGGHQAHNDPETANGMPQVDLTPVTSEIAQLKQQVNSFQQQQERQITDLAQTELQKFASDPEHVYYENVRQDMGKLLQSGLATDLADAYQKACWNHPDIRAELIKKQSATEAEAIRQKETQAVQKARNAAQGVGSDIQAGSSAPPVSNGSLRDDLRAAFAESEGRV